MTLDLTLMGVVLLFAVLGALTGAARQVGTVSALVSAYLFARPLGRWVGPLIAEQTKGSLLLCTLASTLLAWAVVFYVTRAVVTRVLRRLLRDGSGGIEDASVDRSLGFLFGGAKVAVVVWVVLSALTFLHEHVQVMGKRLGVSPKDSFAFQLAARFNLFELTQFGPAQDLVELAKATNDPEKLPKLKSSSAFQALKQDARFKTALEEAPLKKAVESGDTLSVLDSDTLLKLVSDKAFAEKLRHAVESLEATGGSGPAETGEPPPPTSSSKATSP